MDRQFSEILQVCERLGIEVRVAPLGGEGGGLCELHGQQIVFVDAESDVATRVQMCLRVLADCPEVDQVFVPPALRQLLSKNRPAK